MARIRDPFTVALIAIGAIAFLLRLGLRLHRGAEDFAANGYTFFLVLAQHLANGDGFTRNGADPTAFRVPAYPIFLALTGGEQTTFLTITLAQSFVSAGTVVLTGLIARRLFSEPVGILSAMIAMLWPYSLAHDTALQETGLFAFLTMLALWLLFKLHEVSRLFPALLLGVIFGLAILTRVTLLPFAVFALLWLLVPPAQTTSKPGKRLLTSCGAALALAATLAPWLAYSEATIGEARLGTESGSALYTANHPLTFSYYPQESIDKSRHLILRTTGEEFADELLGKSELEQDHWFREQAWASIRANPERTARYVVAKLWAAFGPQKVPREPQLRNLIYIVSWTPLALLGIAGFWLARREWRHGLLFAGLIGSFAAVTMVFWSQTSHKSYLDYSFMIFAAYALCRALSAPRVRALLAHAPIPVQRAAQYFAVQSPHRDNR